MVVKDLAKQLNELYIKSWEQGVDIEDYTVVTDCGCKGFSGVLVVDTEKEVVYLE